MASHPRMKTIRAFTAWRRLRRDENGAAAVEFALVATPFLALLFAIIESAIVLFAGQVLETAVVDSARLIMTGQAQAASMSQAQFKEAVCARITGMFDCANGIYVDVKSFSSFTTVAINSPVQNGTFTNNFTYSPGNAGDVVVVRLYYLYPVYVSLLGLNLADVSGGKRLIAATAAFRNEPF